MAAHVVQVPRQTALNAGAGVTAKSGDLVAKLERFAKKTGIAVHSLVAVGHSISYVLKELAQNEGVKTIVLGWRGNVYERRIRGSVADGVLHGSPSHVLVVRDRGLDESVAKITLALSPGVPSDLIVSTAVSLAKGFDASLRIVTLKVDRQENEELDKWFDDIRKTVQEQFDSQRLETEMVNVDNVVGALINEADKVDLFVMGTSRDWVDKDHLLGQIPDTVANQSSSTVVVVKHEEARVISLLRRFIQMVFGRPENISKSGLNEKDGKQD